MQLGPFDSQIRHCICILLGYSHRLMLQRLDSSSDLHTRKHAKQAVHQSENRTRIDSEHLRSKGARARGELIQSPLLPMVLRESLPSIRMSVEFSSLCLCGLVELVQDAGTDNPKGLAHRIHAA